MRVISSVFRPFLGACAALVLSTAAGTSLAATYFIDSEIGSDSWSGLQPGRIGVPAYDGPWQSLARIASTTLQPGDTVRLRCGQTWRETLRIAQSGTVSAPIRVQSYPDGCTTPPLIDGSVPIPAHNWSLLRGSIYKATLPLNLVENGALDKSIAKWYQWSNAGNASLAFHAACPSAVVGCLALTTGSSGWTLAISPSFPIQGGTPHVLQFQVIAPVGTALVANVRRAGPTNFDSAGVLHSFTATGSWQTITIPFRSLASMASARFDLATSAPQTLVRLRSVRIEPVIGTPTMLLTAGRPLQEAHHPNRGFSAASPKSIYLKNSVDSNVVTTASRTGSTYLTTGTDLALPTGATLTPGISAHMRTDNWHVDRRPITSVAGTRLNFDTATTYPFRANWGYYLTGAAWMLDSSDEWFYEPGSKVITAWMPDGANPGARVSVGHIATGIDVSDTRHVIVQGLAVRGTTVGISLFRATYVTVSGVRVEDTDGVGINVKSTTYCRIEDSTIARTGLDAIEGTGVGGVHATFLTVQGNTISDSGVLVVGDSIVSLPVYSVAAIQTGANAVISRNTIRRTTYHGIRTYGEDASISQNYIGEACLVLDDCGAIYTSWTSNRSSVTGNLIEGVRGDFSGTPYLGTRAVGIYIDEHGQQITATGNTVRDADYGIQIHNASGNTVSGNTLFGNRRLQLWMQEQSRSVRADGDIHLNVVSNNTFVPTTGGPSVLHESYFASTWDFAAYTGNTYSALLSPRVISEIWASGNASFTFAEWRAATVNGTPRTSDANGREVTSSGYAAFRSLGGNIIPNGAITNANIGWSTWNKTAPFGQLYVETCTVGPCLRYVAGSTVSLMSSPSFSVTKDQWYRVSFDARVGVTGQGISVLVREGGGGSAGYESVMGPSSTFNGTTAWTRYNFIFKATRSVSVDDPSTGSLGARVDFERIQASQTLAVANLEMVPLSPVEVGLRIEMVTNPSPVAVLDVDCPVRATQPTLCSQFVRLNDSAPVTWPYRLSPLGREVLFTRDQSLLDTDRDGIPNSQDLCQSTPANAGVKANGCAIGEPAQ